MKTIKTTFLYFGLLLSAISTQNCRPDCDADCSEVSEAPHELLDYINFGPRSWWVYQLQDVDTAIFDTFISNGFVDAGYSDQKSECNEGEIPCVKDYGWGGRHSNYEYFPVLKKGYDGEGFTCRRLNGSEDIWYLSHISTVNGIAPYERVLDYPFNEGDVYHFDTYLADTLKGTWDNMLLEQLILANHRESPYPDVKCCFDTLRMGRSVGILEVMYKNGEHWKLIDYYLD